MHLIYRNSFGIRAVWRTSRIRQIAALGSIAAGAAIVAPLSAQANQDTVRTIVVGEIGKRADSTLSSLQTKGFSGVALVVSNNQTLLKKGYGLSDRAKNIAMSGNSVVQIGSNTKDFTIVSILQLQERGKLSINDSVSKYFADVPADKRGITLRMLLKHQAGFDQHLGGDWEVISRDEEIKKAFAAKLLFAPGTSEKYSNIGYSLLAAIIEKQSGVAYDVYVRDNILKPIGLTETGYLLPGFEPARVARGYKSGTDMGTFLERPHAADGPYWNLRGNGGMLSTVSDMYRFYRVLFSDGPLLKPASRDLFFRTDEPVMLAGSDLTFYFFYSRYPGRKLDIMLAINSTDFPARQAREALDAAAGAPRPEGGNMQISIDTGGPGGRGNGGGRGRGNAQGRGASAPANDRAEIPDTPAGRMVRKYLQAYLNAEEATMTKFFEQEVVKRPDDTRTIADRVGIMKNMHSDLGFLTPIQIRLSTDTEIQVKFRAAMGGEAIFTFSVESAAPYRLLGLRVERD